MCVSCGCGEPNEDHGDKRHITMQQIQQAAEAASISPAEVAQNISKSAQQQSG